MCVSVCGDFLNVIVCFKEIHREIHVLPSRVQMTQSVITDEVGLFIGKNLAIQCVITIQWF